MIFLMEPMAVGYTCKVGTTGTCTYPKGCYNKAKYHLLNRDYLTIARRCEAHSKPWMNRLGKRVLTIVETDNDISTDNSTV